MDSRLKRQAILVALVLFCITILIVWILNRGSRGIQTEETIENETTVPGETYQLHPTNTSYGEYALNLDDTKDWNGFKSNPEFFDKTGATMREKVDMYQNEITVLVSSIAKDIRICIIDSSGACVSGFPFEVEILNLDGSKLDSEDVYRDEDLDGIIYIDNLNAKQYQVQMKEYGTYQLENEKVSVTVKDQIEYRLISDIEYLIKNETEIDESIEDTEVNDALKDADSTELVERLSGDNTGFGIDVSKWNKEIDWKKVKEAGVDYAIVRCGYRGSSSGSLVEDPYFKKNMDGATKAGVKLGVYFFTQATTAVEAVEEASVAISLIKDYQLAYPIFIDTEGAGGNGRADGLDVETRTEVVKTFCETIEASGFNAGVYASKNWFLKKLNRDEVSNYYIWLAEYKSEASYDGNYDFWQYTSSGRVDGIETRVDLNVGYVGF